MIEIIKPGFQVNFRKLMFPMSMVSLVLTVIALAILIFKGVNYGVDFRGGAEIQVKFAQQVALEDVRESLEKNGFDGASVQSIGEENQNEFLVKVQSDEQHLNSVTEKISQSLTSQFQKEGPEIRKTDIVGPKAGAELRLSAFKAMFYSVLAIMIYIGLRFDFKYSPGVVAALFHDVVIVMGIWSILGLEFTLQIVAALLTIIGYSINDTVVIYDRLREHEHKHENMPMLDLLHVALNETLSRTFLTGGSTFLVSASMWVWGGGAISDFFLAFTIGIIIGTWSTIFVASPVTLIVDNIRRKRAMVAAVHSETTPV